MTTATEQTTTSVAREPAWLARYRDKRVTADAALAHLKSGMRVYVHAGCAEPETLIEAMMRRGPEVENVEVVHLLTLGTAPYAEPRWEGHFRHRSLFTGRNVRQAVNEGRADFVPIFLSEIPGLFLDGLLPVDIALIQVSPPDEHGFCSFGVGVECTLAAAQTARVVVAQVNARMPRVHGDNFIHVNRLHYVVEDDRPLVELPRVRMTELHERIGRYVADMVEDGATLQMGIGGIPDAVLYHLKDKRDLGIHTEMFSDGLVELVESGVITGAKKTLHPGKVVASFVLGTRPLFDFIHDNPIVEFHPSNYVNDPFIVAQNAKMVAINSAIQVDLTGQVCSDSMGYDIYSGIGGQVDFIRGAARSKGGIPVLALPSTAKGDSVSRIVLSLDEGAGVVTSRGDVHWVVTEYGAAYLHGRSIRERALALIQIAHPKFRDELTFEAGKQHII
jgi:4-hydroxybutyrate CoA-transferase